MSYYFDGTSGYNITGDLGAGIASSSPYTMACFVKWTWASNKFLLELNDDQTDVNDRETIRSSGTTNVYQGQTVNNAGSGAVVNTAATDIDGGWAGIVYVNRDDTNRTIYISTYTNTANGTPLARSATGPLRYVTIGNTYLNGGVMTGYIAECAVWSRELDRVSAASDTTLVQQYLDSLYSPAIMTYDSADTSLIFYNPLRADGATALANDVLQVGDAGLAITGATYNADHPAMNYGGVKYLKMLVHPSAASESSVDGIVFETTTSGITGPKIGEFTGAAFSADLTAGQAILHVEASAFGGTALSSGDSVVVLARNATYTTGIVSADIIEI